MIRSLLISALILIVAALLGWREKRQYSSEKAITEKLSKEVRAIPGMDPDSPIDIERRKAESAREEKVKTLALDFFEIYLDAAQNPDSVSSEELARLQEGITDRAVK